MAINTVYSDAPAAALLMDVYKPATSNGLGIVVINGSGWYRDLGYDATLLKQSEEFRPATQKLVGAGYTVFVITHRASPRFHVHNGPKSWKQPVPSAGAR